jgi:hypothetical protein
MSAAFGAFRERLYRIDSNWISTPRAEFLSQFSPEFSFYRTSGNRHRHFMAMMKGETVGHVSAFVNRDLRDRDGIPVGSLGFFECVNDDAVAAELLDHATEWLRKETGLQRIWAPVNFDIWHGYRLMTRGFAEKTFYGEPYNKTYYPGFFTRFGFSLKKTWDSVEVQGQTRLKKMIARFEPRYRRLLEEQYRFKPIDVSVANDFRELYRVLVRSYHGMLGITPFAFDDFERILGRYLITFDARLVHLGYDPGGNVAAFSVAYPDYSDSLHAAPALTNPLDEQASRSQTGEAGRVIFYMIGATPEEVEARHGLGSATFYHTMQQIIGAGFASVVFALIADDSGGLRHVGEEIRHAQKSYALYELNW